MEQHRLVIGIPPQMYERLRLDAFVKRISIAEICREALEKYYEDKEEER
jgi:predicted DNA-binding protein